MEVINGIQGFRDLRNYSEAKDIMAANPDYMTNPDVIAKIGQVSPNLGMALVDRAGAARQMWQQQAAQRLMMQTQAWDSAADAYNDTMTKGTGAPADAEKAANGKLQQYYNLIEQQYGPGFANNLRKQMPVWNLETYADTRGTLDRVADAMREPFQAVTTDPKTGEKSVSTVRLLPTEQKDYMRNNPGTVLLKQGESIPETTSYGGALEPGVTSRGELKDNPLGQAAINIGDKFANTPQAQTFNQRLLDRQDIVKALADRNRTGDLTALIKFMHMHNPSIGVTEGSVITAQQAANWNLPQPVVNAWNGLQGNNGSLTYEARRWLDKSTAQMYAVAAEQVAERRQEYGDLAESFGRTPEQKQALRDAVMKRVPMGDKALGLPLGAPEQPETPPKAPLAPEQAAEAKGQYGQVAAVWNNPRATEPQLDVAAKKLTDDDLRQAIAAANKPPGAPGALTDAQTRAAFQEAQRRGWL